MTPLYIYPVISILCIMLLVACMSLPENQNLVDRLFIPAVEHGVQYNLVHSFFFHIIGVTSHQEDNQVFVQLGDILHVHPDI